MRQDPGAVVNAVALAVAFFLANGLPAGTPPKQVGIGDGSGYLRYPEAQATLKLQPGDTLYVRPGTYSGIALGNMSGSPVDPIVVRCDPQAVFTSLDPQSNEFPNIAHVRCEDFRFEKYKTSCMRISGNSHDLMFKHFRITDASGYSFHVYDPTKVFDGTTIIKDHRNKNRYAGPAADIGAVEGQE